MPSPAVQKWGLQKLLLTGVVTFLVMLAIFFFFSKSASCDFQVGQTGRATKISMIGAEARPGFQSRARRQRRIEAMKILSGRQAPRNPAAFLA